MQEENAVWNSAPMKVSLGFPEGKLFFPAESSCEVITMKKRKNCAVIRYFPWNLFLLAPFWGSLSPLLEMKWLQNLWCYAKVTMYRVDFLAVSLPLCFFFLALFALSTFISYIRLLLWNCVRNCFFSLYLCMCLMQSVWVNPGTAAVAVSWVSSSGVECMYIRSKKVLWRKEIAHFRDIKK